MTDYILSLQDLSFRKIYKSILIMWKKAEIWRTINPAWYVFYSNLWGAAGTCNSPALLPLHKRIRRLICITAYNLSCAVHNRLVFMHYFCSASLSDPSQQADGGSLALWLRKSLFHPRPLSLSTNNIAGQTIKGSRPARRNPVPRHKKRMHAVISPPHCPEFNFTQLTSARDKWNINNVIHTERERESSGLFPGETQQYWHIP